jgi:glycosyltransferase involved in cell wall biosynthesis
MNILIYNWKDLAHPDVGGAEIITWELARRLASDGHRVTWFCRSFRGAKAREKVDGIQVVRKGNLLSTYFWGWHYYRRLRTKPDVVVDMLNTVLWQTPLFARSSKKVCYVNQLAKEVFSYEAPRVLAPLVRLAERLQFLSYKKIPFLVYSPSTKSDLVGFGIPEQNIHQFPLGVDHGRYQPARKARYPLFVAVNRLAKMKRTDLTIRAMQSIVYKMPQARLVIMGHGPQENALRELIHSLKLQDNVQILTKDVLFFKKAPKDLKVALMQQAWALVLPSVKEGWGMVVTEAAACGTPSIVSNVTGLKDSVKKNVTGLILSPNPTAAELARAMKKIAVDATLRRQLARGATLWARQLNWEKTYRVFKRALERALTGKPAEELALFGKKQ